MSPSINSDSTMTFSNTLHEGEHQFHASTIPYVPHHTPAFYDSSAPSSRASSPQFEDDDDMSDDDDDVKPEEPVINSNRPLFLNFTPDLSPQTATKKKPKTKKNVTYKINGVNILNRNSLDSNVAMERLKRRRENHNYVERRRRDNINHTIYEISEVVPNAFQPGQKPNKGNILRLALEHVKELQANNRALRQELEMLRGDSKSHSPEDSHMTSPTPSIPVIHPELDPSSPYGIYNRYPNHSSSGSTDTLAPVLPRSPQSLPNSPHIYPASAPLTYSVPNSPKSHYLSESAKELVLPPISLPSVEQLQYPIRHLPTSAPMLPKIAFQPVATPTPSVPLPYPAPNNFRQMPYSGDSRTMGLEKQYGNVCHY